MIVERCVAQLFRAALRRCIGAGGRPDQIAVVLRQGRTGQRLCVRHGEFALAFDWPKASAGRDGVFAFPASVLAQFEGRGDEPVQIGRLTPDRAAAQWEDRGQPRSIEFDLIDPDTLPRFPVPPDSLESVKPEFLLAFHEASLCAADGPTKYAVHRVQLKGKAGQVVASDTRQLLVQGGFDFPFEDDLLVPAVGVFGLPPLQSEEVRMGRTDDHVFVQSGNWTIALSIAKQERFPDWDGLLRRPRTVTSLRLHPGDAEEFLVSLGPKLRSAKSADLHVAVELDRHATLRFDLDGCRREVALAGSEVEGRPLTAALRLEHVLRLVKLGFSRWEWLDEFRPLLAREGSRVFLAMPVAVEQSSPPVTVMPAAASVSVEPQPEPPFTEPIVDESTVASSPNLDQPKALDPVIIGKPMHAGDVLAEADGLRDAVVRAAGHATRLLDFLRQVYRERGGGRWLRRSFESLLDHSNQSKGES